MNAEDRIDEKEPAASWPRRAWEWTKDHAGDAVEFVGDVIETWLTW